MSMMNLKLMMWAIGKKEEGARHAAENRAAEKKLSETAFKKTIRSERRTK